MTRLWFLALGIAWSVNAVLLFALAEAHWGSILYRFFATVLLWLSVLSFTAAFGPTAWHELERLTTRLVERHYMSGPGRATRGSAILPTRKVPTMLRGAWSALRASFPLARPSSNH